MQKYILPSRLFNPNSTLRSEGQTVWCMFPGYFINLYNIQKPKWAIIHMLGHDLYFSLGKAHICLYWCLCRRWEPEEERTENGGGQWGWGKREYGQIYGICVWKCNNKIHMQITWHNLHLEVRERPWVSVLSSPFMFVSELPVAPVSTAHLELQMRTSWPHVGTGDMNSDPQAWTANTILLNHPPSSHFFLIIYFGAIYYFYNQMCHR